MDKIYKVLSWAIILVILAFLLHSCAGCKRQKTEVLPRHLNILILNDLSDRLSNVKAPHDSIIIDGVIDMFLDSVNSKLGARSSLYYRPLSDVVQDIPKPIDLSVQFGARQVAELQSYVKGTNSNENLQKDLDLFKETIFKNLRYTSTKIDLPSQIGKYINNKTLIKTREINPFKGFFLNKIILLTDGYNESGNQNGVSQEELSKFKNEILKEFPSYSNHRNKEQLVKDFIRSKNKFKLDPISVPENCDVEIYILETTSRDKKSHVTTENGELLTDNFINHMIYELWAEENKLKLIWEEIDQFDSSYDRRFFEEIFK